MRVALIHDWLTGMRGGERCLEVFLSRFPEAEIFTLLYDSQAVTPIISGRKVTASVLNRLPGIKKYYRYLLPFYPQAGNQLGKQIAQAHKEQPFDLVISVSHCAAKNVTLPEGVPHLCYCLTPIRYIWDQYQAYFAGRRHEPIVRKFLPRLRRWDQAAAKKVTSFAAISAYIQQRIAVCYQRSSVVIFPPVRQDWIRSREPGEAGRGFLCVNALVPYKNVDVIIKAFNQLGLPLTIVGDGPEKEKLVRMAGRNITFVSNLSDRELADLYKSSKALVFAAEEDFGMTPVEMQFAGRPVIAYGKGGALETVDSAGSSPTGVHFYDLTTDAISAAVRYFTENEQIFTVENCQQKAREFSEVQFFRNLELWLDGVMSDATPEVFKVDKGS